VDGGTESVKDSKTFASGFVLPGHPIHILNMYSRWGGYPMKIIDSGPQVDGSVRYLLRDGHGKITVDVRDKEMTGFARHGYKGDEDRALKKAFKFLESKRAPMPSAQRSGVVV